MKEKAANRKHRGFYVVWCVLGLLFAAVLELNKNTLLGWAVFIAVMAGFLVLHKKVLSGQKGFVRFLGWIALLIVLAGILVFTWPRPKPIPAVRTKDPAKTEAVMTAFGPVVGVTDAEKNVDVFAGIPYAAPPVGELRFRPPKDPASWTEPLLCDTFAPMSMQERNLPIYDSLAQIIGYHDYKISLTDNSVEPVSEDSLYLNIWKPAGPQTGLPVLVYIHGGSLQTGQPSYGPYAGGTFASNGVICVNMGYRLGVFGFFADETLLAEDGTTGNYGLLDQIKALEWVRDNIAAFGGDPGNVTIVGESAGSVCVDALCVSPLAKGLFRRAILESSTLAGKQPPHSYRLFPEAVSSGKELLARYGCSSADDLRALPAEKIVGEMNTQHHVTVDGYVLPDTPYALRKAGVHNEEAILHGYNAEESGPFIIFSHANLKNYQDKVRRYFREEAEDVLALYPAGTDAEADKAWAGIYGTVFFNYPHFCLNRLANEEGVPVWEYYFSKDNGQLGSWHSGELIYAFANIPADSRLYDASDRELSKMMHTYWVNFATCGDPNGEGLPAFPQNTDNKSVFEFGAHTGIIEDPYLALYEIMDRMQDKAA